MENNENKPANLELLLNYSVVTVKELFNNSFVNAFIKLRSVALPIHQVKALKKFGTDILIAKTNELAAEQNKMIEKYGVRLDDGRFTVRVEELPEDMKVEFTKLNEAFWSQIIETELPEKFLLPHSTATLTVDDYDLIERFIRVPKN